MLQLKKLLSLAVPVATAVVAFLHARALGSLVDATVPTSEVLPIAEANAAEPAARRAPSADAILARNPFDHTAGALRPSVSPGAARVADPRLAPPCEGVRAEVVVRAADASSSFAALETDGRRLLRRRGADLGGVGDVRVVFVGEDRVWLEKDGALCQARVFGAPAAAPAAPAALPPSHAPVTALEAELAGKIVRSGPNELQIDRGAVDRILEAQTELMNVPLVPERRGDRVVGVRLARVRPGSVLTMLGLQQGDVLVAINGFETTSPEKMLEAYARLRAGTLDHLTVHVLRGGKPMNIDLYVR